MKSLDPWWAEHVRPDCCFLMGMGTLGLWQSLILSHGFPPARESLFLSSFSDQVLDWIENHGEAFLSKHTGVGKSLHRARALQKRHDDFEEVAQVRRCVWLCGCMCVELDEGGQGCGFGIW